MITCPSHFKFFYSFKIAAPEGRKVRIGFIPRGGKAGIVGMLGGDLLTTSPFGGVFYPVELTFQLLPTVAASSSSGPSAQR